MCKYCTKEVKDERHQYLIDDKGLLLFIKNNSLHAIWEEAFGGYPTADTKINYCPMCGRKLSD